MSNDCRDYPILVLEDRYTGVYSGGRWVAIAEWTLERLEHVDAGTGGDDCTAASFRLPDYCAVGDTPDEAVANLQAKRRAIRAQEDDS